MHERRFHGEVERLRTPQRVALLEVERVVNLSVEGINATTVLDVGTGSGIFAEAFEKKGLLVAGIDPNTEMLSIAQQFVSTGVFLEGTIEQIPLKDKSFDLVFLGHILHESDDIMQALYECFRVARKRIAILEWPCIQEENGPPLEHRLKTEEILSAAKQVGFSSVKQFNCSIWCCLD
jgi:ubiquinone/menaquinone biosynthesis C-methylase UbiE